MSGCTPQWRCLRYGCKRCDRDRARQSETKEFRKVLREYKETVASRDRERTIEERLRRSNFAAARDDQGVN